MIAKALFLAKTFYRSGARFFRDHESRPAEYPGGYLCEGAASRASDKVVCAGQEAGVRPRMARSRGLSYSMARMVPAMLVYPAWRMSPMARLRSVARTRGREPARTLEASSAKVRSRTRLFRHHTAPSLPGDG